MSSQQSKYVSNWYKTESLLLKDPVAPCLRFSRSGISQNKQLVLSWSRLPQDVFRTHGPSVTHICINASEDTNSSPSVEGGPYPWYGHLVRNWTSGHQNIRTSSPSRNRTSECQMVHQNCPSPLIIMPE